MNDDMAAAQRPARRIRFFASLPSAEKLSLRAQRACDKGAGGVMA